MNMDKRRSLRIIIALALALLLAIIDQWSKAAVVRSIPLGGTVVVIPGFFELTYLQNFGAAFSSLEGVGMWFFAILTLIAVAVMLYYLWKTKDKWVAAALTLLLAGAIGNLIDRLWLGYVRDFFRFYIFGSPFAVFNVADVCITAGFILLAFAMLLDECKARKKA